MTFASFSQRVLGDARIQPHPEVPPGGPQANQDYVMAVKDQLLVSAALGKSVKVTKSMVDGALQEMYGFTPILLTTLLDQLNQANWPAVDDVLILEIDLAALRGSTIYQLVDHLRAHFVGHPPRIFSPNHVAIPAPNDWGCPYGPPSPSPKDFVLPVAQEPRVAVAVIDCGFNWDATKMGPPPAAAVAHQQAELLPTAAQVKNTGPHWQAGTVEGLVTVPDINRAQRLVALTGHAVFTQSQIFAGCPHAMTTGYDHHGSFLDRAGVELPTEFGVARSLCQAALAGRPPKVIDVEFAFPVYEDMPSMVWDTALTVCGFVGTPPAIDFASSAAVVAPAGNQNSSVPRFPGALSHMFQAPPFQNVICVGSTAPATSPPQPAAAAGPYSNNGPWVTCSVDGTNVVSSFPKVSARLEDAETAAPVRLLQGFAQWTGTSFSAPQVAAMISCEIVAGGLNPMAAFQQVVHGAIATPELGLIL